MRLILNIFEPVTYELVEPDKIESLNFLSDSDLIPGSNKLKTVFGNSDFWRNSRCLGINFQEKLKNFGYDIDDYDRDCSYILSSEAARAIISDLPNYPEATVLIEDGFNISDLTKTTIYEMTNKKDNTALLLVEPSMENFEKKVLPCLLVDSYELEVPNQGAIDYYTSDSIYVLDKAGFDEILDGFPDAPDGLKTFNFIEGRTILRWEGVLKEQSEKIQRPWRIKLDNLKKDIDKVLESKGICNYIRNKRITELIKKYYGKF